MTDRARARWVFLPVLLLGALYAYSTLNLPTGGDYRGPYGDVVARLAVYERHTTDVVNAINYDYRAFDTLGEEFILFTAVLGVSMLLRREEGKSVMPAAKVADAQHLSAAVRMTTLPAVLLTIVFGLYIGLHGQLTPGGGFQAGVILAAAPVLIYLSENTESFQRITSPAAGELIEAIGAGGYALIGLAPLLLGAPLLTNFLPLGETGDVFSSGTVALISATVGVEVTCSFLVVISTYLDEIIRGQVPEA